MSNLRGNGGTFKVPGNISEVPLYFLDNFDGAGSLRTHTPDIGNLWSAWEPVYTYTTAAEDAQYTLNGGVVTPYAFPANGAIDQSIMPYGGLVVSHNNIINNSGEDQINSVYIKVTFMLKSNTALDERQPCLYFGFVGDNVDYNVDPIGYNMSLNNLYNSGVQGGFLLPVVNISRDPTQPEWDAAALFVDGNVNWEAVPTAEVATVFPFGTWHTVVLKVEPSQVSVFVDGVLKATMPATMRDYNHKHVYLDACNVIIDSYEVGPLSRLVL